MESFKQRQRQQKYGITGPVCEMYEQNRLKKLMA